MFHLAKIVLLVSLPAAALAQAETRECREAVRSAAGWGAAAIVSGAGCGLSVSSGNVPGAVIACPAAAYSLGQVHQAVQEVGRQCPTPMSGGRRAD